MESFTIKAAFGHHQAGRLDEAEAIYRQILKASPRHPVAIHYLGVVALQRGQCDQAIELIQQSIALDPRNADFYNNLGNVLDRQKRWEAAADAFGKALALRPGFADAMNNLGGVLVDLERYAEGIEWCQRALAIHRDYSSPCHNIGQAMFAQNRPAEALPWLDRALQLRPDDAQAHFTRALVLLTLGRLREGFGEYEWRWKWDGFTAPRRDFAQPVWDGRDLAGKTILLYTEQGYGDAIQFVRFATMAAQRGGEVVTLCPPGLKSLLESVGGISRVVGEDETLPQFDVQLPMLSLPYVLSIELGTIPAQVPYLSAPADQRALWQGKLDGKSVLKVGLVWAGSSQHANDRNRSIRLSRLTPLASIPGVKLFSLQKGEQAAELASLPSDVRIVDLGSQVHDFGQTAAIVEQLDLVISVDTAMAHLAGALGKRCWTLITHRPEWRWLWGRTDSPWYPTMRLFRQPTAGDWQSAIEQVAVELRQLAAAK